MAALKVLRCHQRAVARFLHTSSAAGSSGGGDPVARRPPGPGRGPGDGLESTVDGTAQRSALQTTNLTRPPAGCPTAPTPVPSTERRRPAPPVAQVTRLDNGLRVASLPALGGWGCTVGLMVAAGSRHQSQHPLGVAHLVEKLGFGSSERLASHAAVQAEVEACGGIHDTQATRDVLVYALSASARGLPRAVALLADVGLRQRVSEPELAAAHAAVSAEWEALRFSPLVEPLMQDLVHAAAYKNNTLGLARLCPEETRLTRAQVLAWLAAHHRPERMVLAGVGVEHDALLAAAEGALAAGGPSTYAAAAEALPPDSFTAQFTGGAVALERDFGHMPGMGLPELTHVWLGLQSAGSEEPHFVAACLLAMLMGGGGSFSAGGPGKGMYTRLYLRLLNRFWWVNHAQAMNQAYPDSGLFVLQANAEPGRARDLARVVAAELGRMLEPVEAADLARAKRQLRSMLLMNLESRPVVFEDVARQVLASPTGAHRPSEYWTAAIDAVTGPQLQEVAARMLATPPALAVCGRDARDAVSYEQLCEWLQAGSASASSGGAANARTTSVRGLHTSKLFDLFK